MLSLSTLFYMLHVLWTTVAILWTFGTWRVVHHPLALRYTVHRFVLDVVYHPEAPAPYNLDGVVLLINLTTSLSLLLVLRRT